MRRLDEPVRSLQWFRLAVLASISIAAVSCSTETQRFGEVRAKNSSNEVTGSVAPQRHAGGVQSAPLPPPGAPATRVAGGGVSGGSKGMASYQPGSPEVTGAVPAQQGAPR